MKNRVVVGLSGGVDSAVSAYLLQKQGFEVIGVFMRNWHDESVVINNECPWIDDSNDAMLVANHLGIPFQVLDLSAEYKSRIVDYMFREYEAGRTPNPDVLCNREIKFDLFLNSARMLKADFMATGHYCRKDQIESGGKTIYRLLAGNDPDKDQSYFLCQISQQQLAHALFPIGHLKKSEVRKIAREIDLPNAEKKDSQGLCFVGKIRLPVFLQQQLEPRKGDVIEISPGSVELQPIEESGNDSDVLIRPYRFSRETGVKIGEHQGIHNYTIGQRKGLRIGGYTEPLFILELDPINNIVFVGEGENHPALFRRGLTIKGTDEHWLRNDLNINMGEKKKFMVRIRYRQPLSPCEILRTPEGLELNFDQSQRGIARGQFAAWYNGDELVGSGVIS